MRKYYLILIVSLSSCSSGFLVTGEYSSRVNSNRFLLNKYSSFTYDYRFSHAYEYSTGSWIRFNKNKIRLNSWIKNTAVPLITQESDSGKDGVNIKSLLSVSVNIPNANNENYRCAIFINDTLFQERRCDSLSSIPINLPIKKIYFAIRKRPLILTDLRLSVDPIVTTSFSPKFPTPNKLQIGIEFNDSLFSYRVFDNEILTVRKRGLRFYDPKRSEWQYIPKSSD